jgi:hypothetical protein
LTTLADRLTAMHLAERLPAGSLAKAAYAGLQDTAPRAALLSLHARVEGVGPDTWEDPSLVQVWGPRSAVWVVPADAVATFTLGRLPRDAAAVRRLEQVASEALSGAPDPYRRAGAATGRYLIRWDARTTNLIPITPPDVDPEDARRDLARRYLTWFGEAMRHRFAHWAGVSDADAAETLRAVGPVPSSNDDGAPTAPTGVRLLPLFDPFMYGRTLPTSPHRELVGTILVDGSVAGTWARQANKVTVRPRSRRHVDRIEDEARSLAGPIGRAIALTVA